MSKNERERNRKEWVLGEFKKRGEEEEERFKEKKCRESEQKQKQRTKERQIGRKADCSVL